MMARMAGLTPAMPPTATPSSSNSQQSIPLSDDLIDSNPLPSTPPQQAATVLPQTPTHLGTLPLVGQPPGTPISQRRAAALRAQEERARQLHIDAFMEPDIPIAEPLMDDDWEEPPLPEEEPASIPPSLAVVTPNSADTSPSSTSLLSRVDSAIDHFPPICIGVPDHKHDENTPDPFYKPSTSLPLPPPDSTAVHPHPGVYLLYMLVSWLHLQFHLPVRACTALMNVVCLIIQSFGQTVNPPPTITLHRIMGKLEVEPTFNILPMCPSCLEVYPDTPDTPSICKNCSTFVFKANQPRLGASSHVPASTQTPLLRFPYKSIESQLVSVLSLPGIEEELDGWRRRVRIPGKYFDVFDGEITKNLKAADGTNFFRNDLGDLNGPNGELRIAVTLGVDWYVH